MFLQRPFGPFALLLCVPPLFICMSITFAICQKYWYGICTQYIYLTALKDCFHLNFDTRFSYSKEKGPKKCNICFCRNLLRKLIFHSNFQLLLCALAVCRVPGDSIRPSLFKTYSEKRLKYLSTYFFVVYKPLKVGRWVCVVT